MRMRVGIGLGNSAAHQEGDKHMARLEAKQGKINSVTRFNNGPMEVVFRHAAIAPSGDLGSCLLVIGNDRVEMTYAQAISFANEVLRRCQQ